MTALAFDGASPFDLAAAKNAGAVAITGYIVGNPGGFGPINKARVEQIRSMGMGFVPNWERGAAYLISCGKPGGVAAGQETVAALRALGVPDDGTVACYFSWDAYVQPGQYSACGAVADGIIEGLAGHYLFDAYGQGGLIQYLIMSGRIRHGLKSWLSMSEGFPGFNVDWSTYVAMVQQHHADGSWFASPVAGTDVNTVLDPHALGAWWPASSPYASSGDIVLDTATQTQITAIVREVLREELPRIAGVIRWGSRNAAYNATNAGQLVDGLGIQGTIQKAVAAQQTAQVDVAALAAALAPQFGAEMGKQVAQAIGQALTTGATA